MTSVSKHLLYRMLRANVAGHVPIRSCKLTKLAEMCLPAAHLCCRYGERLVPDVWFDAKSVWEVKAADLSISPLHQAAAGMADAVKGISIRFPRLVRVRDDKNPDQATNQEQVVEMYQKQPHVQGNKGSKASAAEDY